jgi:hypothetical protein
MRLNYGVGDVKAGRSHVCRLKNVVGAGRVAAAARAVLRHRLTALSAALLHIADRMHVCHQIVRHDVVVLDAIFHVHRAAADVVADVARYRRSVDGVQRDATIERAVTSIVLHIFVLVVNTTIYHRSSFYLEKALRTRVGQMKMKRIACQHVGLAHL